MKNNLNHYRNNKSSHSANHWWQVIFEKYGIVILILVFAVVISLINPRFLTVENVLNLSRHIVPIGLVAISMTFVIISAGIDFSAGWGVALLAVVTGIVFDSTGSALTTVLIVLLLGLCIGTINGLVIAYIKVQPFIATLATMSILYGLTFVLSQGVYIFVVHPFFRFFGSGTVGILPSSFLLLVVIYIIGYILLNHTRMGVYTYAIGGHEKGTELAGVNVKFYKLIAYLLSGFTMSLAAINIIARIALVTPNLGGITLLLDSIAAVIIGGTNIYGGKGTIQGTFLGVILIGMIGNAMNLLNVPPVFQEALKGMIIIIAVYTQVLTRGKGGMAYDTD